MQKTAISATRGAVLDRLLGTSGDSPTDTLFVIDAGGPAVDFAAAGVEDIHVFEYDPGDPGGLLTADGPRTRRLDRFHWRMPTYDAPPRAILSQGGFLQELAGLTGVSADMGWVVLSVETWTAALNFLRRHGPFGATRGVAILAAMPVATAPRAEFEDLLDGTVAMLVDSDRARRAVGGGSASQVRLDAVGASFSDVLCEAGLVTATLTCTGDLPEGVSVVARHGDAPVAIALPRPLDETRRRFSVELELPRSLQFDTSVAAVTLQLAATDLGKTRVQASLPSRRFINAEELLDADFKAGIAPGGRKPFGIVLYSHTRTDSALLVLESLKRQGALPHVELWMDGDQGNPVVRDKLNAAEQRLRDFGVPVVRRHRGNIGFRKLILHSLFHMCTTYERFLVLEDDCFPSENAVTHFQAMLDRHAGDPRVLTVYGSHFQVPGETGLFPRFQGWGWATWSDKLLPVLHDLAYLYSLPEPAFVDWTKSVLTPEIVAAVDCTPPRKATETLTRFFAWDETLTLLAALRGQMHAPTATRCIFNFGAGGDSTHFTNIDWYRKPPFNMILKDEVWEHFHESGAA